MNRGYRILITIATASVACGLLWLQLPVAMGSGMGAVLAWNATDAKIQKDLETHLWSIEESVRWNPHEYHTLYRLGFHRVERREFEQARAAYEACLESSPGHLGALLGLAELSVRAGEFDRARALTERALAVAPTSWRARLGAGMLEARTGNIEQALIQLEKADQFARAPEVGIFNQMGAAYLLVGEATLALQTAERALNVAPGNAEAFLVKGKALALLGRTDESIGAFRTAARRARKDPMQKSDAQVHLAGALVETGNLTEASEVIRDEVRENSDIPEVRATANRVLARVSERFEEARLTPELAGMVQCNLGFAYAALGSLDQASIHFLAAEETGAELDSECIWAHAEVLLRLGRSEQAVSRYQSVVASADAPVEMRIGLAEALEQSGRSAEARVQYQLLLRGYPLTDEQRSRIQTLAEQLN